METGANMGIRKIFTLPEKIVDKILPNAGGEEPRPLIPIEDGRLLMNEHGGIHVNFDHPEVRKKILYQLKNYPRLPVKQEEK